MMKESPSKDLGTIQDKGRDCNKEGLPREAAMQNEGRVPAQQTHESNS